jgi:hypothetical protein
VAIFGNKKWEEHERRDEDDDRQRENPGWDDANLVFES